MAPPRVQPIEKTCTHCGKVFHLTPSMARKGRGLFCSVQCNGAAKAINAERITCTCVTCGAAFVRLVSQLKATGAGQYCSRNCIPKPEPVPRSCDHCGVVFVVPIRLLRRGKGRGRYCSLRCQRDSQKTPLGPSKSRPGVETWRRQVVERDGYTCQQCGAKPTTVYAHHIKEWSKYPELRFELSNGVTLCYACHRSYHATAA